MAKEENGVWHQETGATEVEMYTSSWDREDFFLVRIRAVKNVFLVRWAGRVFAVFPLGIVYIQCVID